MKPTSTTINNASRRDSFDPIMRKDRRSPITDCNYQSVPLEHSSAKYASASARSFWNIAGDYFKNEARHEFLGEAAVFGVIIVTAFLPLLSNAHALMEFIRVIGSY
jgi:hypothetical protein